MTHPFDTFLQQAKDALVLVVGDVMLDAYLWGKVARISPEAPVPIVQVTERSARLGGAANVALNLRALGAEPLIMSVVGDDADSRTMMERIQANRMEATGLLRSTERRTTVKTRVISGHQHIVRVDEEDIRPLSEGEEQSFIELLQRTMTERRPAAVLMEDYNKGVLSPRVIEATIAAAKKAGVPVAVDPKTENFLAYKGVELFKPNVKELREGLKVDLDPADPKSVARAVVLLEKELKNAITMLTLSEYGLYLHSGAQEHLIPAHHRRIADVSGAGDTVIAIATLALAQGASMRTIAELANLAGGLVCEEVGVVPVDRERFRAEAMRLELLK